MKGLIGDLAEVLKCPKQTLLVFKKILKIYRCLRGWNYNTLLQLLGNYYRGAFCFLYIT